MLRAALASARLPLRSKLSTRSVAQRGYILQPHRLTHHFSKAFSTTSAWRTINSLHTFSEEEELLRESGMVRILS